MKKLLNLFGVLFLGSFLWANEDEQNARAQGYFDGKLNSGKVVQLANKAKWVVLPQDEAARLENLDYRARMLKRLSRENQERREREAALEKANKTNKRIASVSFLAATLAPMLYIVYLAIKTSWLPWVVANLMIAGLMIAYFAERQARENEEMFRRYEGSFH